MSRYKILLGETELKKESAIETFGFCDTFIIPKKRFLRLEPGEWGKFGLVYRDPKDIFIFKRVHWSSVLKNYFICKSSECCRLANREHSNGIYLAQDKIACCVVCYYRGLYEVLSVEPSKWVLYTWVLSKKNLDKFSGFFNHDFLLQGLENAQFNRLPANGSLWQKSSIKRDLINEASSFLSTSTLGRDIDMQEIKRTHLNVRF